MSGGTVYSAIYVKASVVQTSFLFTVHSCTFLFCLSNSACHCHTAPHPGQWTDWNPWTRCTVHCGGGEQVRSRECFFDTPVCTDKGITVLVVVVVVVVVVATTTSIAIVLVDAAVVIGIFAVAAIAVVTLVSSSAVCCNVDGHCAGCILVLHSNYYPTSLPPSPVRRGRLGVAMSGISSRDCCLQYRPLPCPGALQAWGSPGPAGTGHS